LFSPQSPRNGHQLLCLATSRQLDLRLIRDAGAAQGPADWISKARRIHECIRFGPALRVGAEFDYLISTTVS